MTQWREIGGEVVLAHGGQVMVLNSVGNHVWRLLEEPTTVEALEANVQARWPGQEVGDDVRAFLARLDELGLIEHS